MSSAPTVPNQAKQGKQITISAKCVTVPPVFHQAFASLSLAQIKSLISGRIKKKDLSAPGRLELSKESDSHDTHLSPGDADMVVGWGGCQAS